MAAVLAAALVLTTACTTMVAGSASPDGSGPPPPTTAQSVPGAVAAPRNPIGRRLEAHRLAGVTELVAAVFPDRGVLCDPHGAFPAATDLAQLPFLASTAPQVVDGHGYVTGWAECGQDEAQLTTVTASMELSDPASARAAVSELAVAAARYAQAPPAAAPDGAVVLLNSVKGEDVVEIWAPVGRMVAFTLHEAPAGQGVKEAVRMSVEEAKLLAGFAPTPQGEVGNLPIDPDGVARLVVDLPGVPDPDDGPYDLESYLRLSVDPIRERDLLEANGFSSMYVKSSTEGPRSYAAALYTFPSSTESNAVYDRFAELERTAFGGTAFVLPSVPAAPCFVVDASTLDAEDYNQRCYVGYGSHLASVDVYDLTRPDDTASMDLLLPRQRDLIAG